MALREIGCCQIRETNNRCQCGLCDGKPFESLAPEVPESYIRYPLAVLECACILTTSSENNAVAASNSKTNQPVMATSIRMIVFVHWMAWVMRGRAPKSRLLKLGFSIDEVGWPRRFSMLLKRCLTAKCDCCAMDADLASYGIFLSIPRAYPFMTSPVPLFFDTFALFAQREAFKYSSSESGHIGSVRHFRSNSNSIPIPMR